MENNDKRIAVLIDAENVSFKLVDEIFDEIALLGRVTHRRVYGDFTTSHMTGWNAVATDFALRQVTQRHSKNGKNSSDIVLVIDAMDILHAGKVDAICIVSNDNDFTRLAMRIVEAGLDVIGLGEEGKTGHEFVKACSTFKHLTDKNNGPGNILSQSPAKPKTLESTESNAALTEPPPPSSAKTTQKKPEAPDTPKPLSLSKKNVISTIKNALDSLDSTDGWVPIGQVGNVLHNRWPDFDPRSIQGLGIKTKQLGAFLKTLPDFEITVRGTHPHLRLKKAA
ncbi:NYN domain-containing protein [Geminisphaera colitermitum]|uniref:NYN domain-containing protein n=1 Tax=Geminisphaera colitermitum TaxID=1148786 RepID=UPI000158CE6D|nr:NYN domain-containing protein [Geminisphaera colitermitum]